MPNPAPRRVATSQLVVFCLPGLPAPGADELRRAGRASRLFPQRVRRAAEVARRGAPTPTSSRSANSCPARRAARSASPSASCAPGCPARSPPGSASRCPSALAMIAFGYGVARLGDVAQAAWLHGLKIVAVAVVAQAVWGMARKLCPDRLRATLAIARGAAGARFAQCASARSARSSLGGLIGWRLLPAETKPAHSAIAIRIAEPLAIAALIAVLRAACRPAAARRRDAATTPSRSSTASIARARWSSAAVTSCCRCCRQRSCRRAGSATTRSLPATARRRRCPARSSPSLPISAR